MTDAVRSDTVPDPAGKRGGGYVGGGGAGGDAGDHGGSGKGKGEKKKCARCGLVHHTQAACWEVCTICARIIRKLSRQSEIPLKKLGSQIASRRPPSSTAFLARAAEPAGPGEDHSESMASFSEAVDGMRLKPTKYIPVFEDIALDPSDNLSYLKVT